MRLVLAGGGVGLIAALCACPGSLEDPARFTQSSGPWGGTSAETPPNLADCPDIPALLASTCTSPGCHNAQDRAQGLDLASPNAGTRIRGVRASEGAGVLIDPDAPARSVLYTKLTAQPPFGARMPPGRVLDDGTIACVLSWVLSIATADTADASNAADTSGDSAIDH
jgi:hypothetical protein